MRFCVWTLALLISSSCGQSGQSGAIEPGSESPVDLSVVPTVLEPGEQAQLVLRNSGSEAVEYGAVYKLERWEDGQWKRLDPCPSRPDEAGRSCAWPMWLRLLAPAGEQRQEITAPEKPGLYRIGKTTNPGGTVAAELEVHGDAYETS